MPEIDTLPVVLISAENELEARSVMNELITQDVTDEYNKEEQCCDRVWRLDNKYYRADVRVHVLSDDSLLLLNPEAVEAHIIYINDNELSNGESFAERRAACAAWSGADVRVLLLGADHDAPALRAWARARSADLVPRCQRAPDPAPDDDDEEELGMARVRSALQAHHWTNLVRKHTGPSRELDVADLASSGSESESEWAWSRAGAVGAVGEGEAGDGEDVDEARVALFAAALERLGAAPRGQLAPRPERLERAEELVMAFCRALGVDPDAD